MNEKNFKTAVYFVLGILILIFYTKDIPIFEKGFYKDVQLVEHPDNVLVLVNKNNRLKELYRPSDLESIDINYANEEKYLRKNAKNSFEKLSSDAQQLGYRIVAVSAFRDYDYQEHLYSYYVETKGQDYADLCSARPGHSEHQTGLALDVEGSNGDYNDFLNSPEFDWMKNHAHEYGFILRYPEGKEHITGFKYEPWHYRYIGVDPATYIYQNNITLEEYIANFTSLSN